MFVKEELNEGNSKERKLSLDASLKRADEEMKKNVNEKTLKLRNHSLKVPRLGTKSKYIDVQSESKNFTEHWDLLKTMNGLDNLENFQIYMQKPETLIKASKMVSFLEDHCSKECCESVKSRPKIFMSLALLALYPSDVMPNADSAEKAMLEQASAFYDKLCSFFVDEQNYSIESHKEMSWSWIRAIHAFDEWFVKDKQVLFEKMKTDFLTWAKTIASLSIDDKSRYEWEPNALKYQNEILKRMHEIFGQEHINILKKELQELNKSFEESELIIDMDKVSEKYSCKWEKKSFTPEKMPENAQFNESTINVLETTNIRILHELMIKEIDFKFENILEMSGKSIQEISQSNRNNLNKLINVLETASDSQLVASVLQDLFQFIRSSLYELAGDNDDYCQEINLIDCSVDPNNWMRDSYDMVSWALSMCQKCCAPARDSNCKDLEGCIGEFERAENHENTSETLTKIIALLLDLLNLMRNDFCNFRLKFLAAQIDGKGIVEKYELEEFKKAFSSYAKTEKWISKHNSKNLMANEILINFYVSIFDSAQNVLESDLPETFYLDIERIKRYHVEFETNLKKEAGLIYLKNHLRSSKELSTEKDEFLSKTKENVNLAKDSKQLQTIFEQSLNEMPKDDIYLLKGNIRRLFDSNYNDKVFLLLKNRELSTIRSVLMKEQKIPSETLMGKICSLFRYNKSCFSSVYDEIILKK